MSSAVRKNSFSWGNTVIFTVHQNTSTFFIDFLFDPFFFKPIQLYITDVENTFSNQFFVIFSENSIHGEK